MTKAGADDTAALTGADISRIGALLYRWTGMIFGESKRYFIERRISERMTRTAAADIAAYLDFAETDAGEREALINAFTVNESYFYREEHQFAALSNHILPRIVSTKAPGDLVRIWSMPCSTGEEAYSIALWLLENWKLVDAYNVEIVGSDIDSAALNAAREGRFGTKSLAKLPPGVAEYYFAPEEGRRRKIIDDLRESVHFTLANIIDRSTLQTIGTFDVIFCRNLLIYFDDESRQTAVSNLHGVLNDGGFVCLGHSESMTRISDKFTMVRFDNAIVYSKT